jgi:hypothetical protein
MEYKTFTGTVPRQLHTSTFTASYSQNEMVQHIIFCVVSDCSKQDAVPVHIFQSKLHRLLPGTFKVLTKIYFSGNTALQCKKEEEFH